MKCRVCGYELEDLTMYCTQCGAKQYEEKPREVELIMPDAKNSRIIVQSYDNLTKALSSIRELTGLSIAEINAILKNLPAQLLGGLEETSAREIASVLEEKGIHVTIEGKKGAVIAEEDAPVDVEETIAEPVSEPEETIEETEPADVIEEPEQEECTEAEEVTEEPVIEETPAEAAETPAEEEKPVEEAEAPKDDGEIELTIEPTTLEGIEAEIMLIDESTHYGHKEPDEIVLTGAEPKKPLPESSAAEDAWSDFEKEMNAFMKKDEE
ncbi:MAG: zinc ribbon domain-containing protein [Solobacterium sp.]|nr:zinc ribbon domain-containing protein [Solobacterium sp.]